ncbi:MAG: hypothetical protein QOG62_1312 [Thermoleophilaceae bacterium]|jgi:hypothetical protein|nr:hypothetical protein [Thermoleophilaceae bacterium]
MTWQVVTAANIVLGVTYLIIAWIVGSGLAKSGQLRSNKLGLATMLIFLTCGIHHFSHGAHMLLPSFGIHDPQALAMRQAWHWENAVWDVIGAGVGLYYLSLRNAYASVLRGAALFEDLKARERQAAEINDTIVQGLAIAKYSLDTGRDEQTRAAIEESLRRAKVLISDLLEGQAEGSIEPGDLRRAQAAEIVSRPGA